MLYLVDTPSTKWILQQPESGMGYQVLRNGRKGSANAHDRKCYLVLNARYAIEIGTGCKMICMRCHRDDFEKLAEFERTLEEKFTESDKANGEDYEKLCCQLACESGWRKLRVDFKRMKVETHGGYPSSCLQGEEFMRYSAFRKDRRIQSDGSVMKGTYATTENDSAAVLSGLVAVARYALPNPMPAIYPFRIRPSQGIRIRVGTTSPAYSQAGGGVEVRFKQDTSAGSVSSLAPIAER